jgi:GNAT superfamily N-acetyltransferase
MDLKVIKAGIESIGGLRKLFLWENHFQFVYNKCHENGWADTWLFLIDGEKAGYGAIWGADRREDRDAIFEFYLVRPFRNLANLIFQEFCAISGAALIECQSNDMLLSSMLYAFAENINAEAVLFEDGFQPDLSVPGVIFCREEGAITNEYEADGYFLELDGDIVATGGLMLNYNKPYADIYMEVKEPFRQKGFGSLIIQELKKECYLMGRVPAARCNISNEASKATLLKAGLKVCGSILKEDIKIMNRLKNVAKN